MQQPQFQPEQPLSVTLQAQEWNIVIAALGEIPFKIAAPLVEKLRSQVMQQAEPMEAPPQQPTRLVPRPNGDGRQAQAWVPPGASPDPA